MAAGKGSLGWVNPTLYQTYKEYTNGNKMHLFFITRIAVSHHFYYCYRPYLCRPGKTLGEP
jgi:hypothetical protein